MSTTKKNITTDISRAKGRPKCFCRNEALNKAMQVFCEKGYEGTSISQLGEAMRMNPPSLYNAFNDKENLFIEVLDYYHKPYEEMVQNIFDTAKNTKEAIRELMNLFKSYHGKPQATGCLVVNSSVNAYAEGSPIAQKIKSLHDKSEAQIRDKLYAGQKNGEIPKDINIPKLTHYIYGILQGSAVIARGQQSPDAVKDLIDQGYEGFLKLARLD